MRLQILAPIAATALAFSATAQAQDTVPLTVTFDGTVAENPADGILIRTYDPQTGSSIEPFVGVAPDYPYQTGDSVTFTIGTLIPTQQTLSSSINDYALQPDGTYRFELVSPNQASGREYGVINSVDVSGPIDSHNLGGSGLAVIIDPTDYSFTLAMRDHWTLGSFDGPGYTYDPVSGALNLSDTVCDRQGACAADGYSGFGFFSNDLTSISSSRLPIYLSSSGLPDRTYNGPINGIPQSSTSSSSAGITSSSTGGLPGGNHGYFSLLFSGGWSISSSNNSDPTQVPEPGMLLLFGAGAAAVFQRRRKKACKQTA